MTIEQWALSELRSRGMFAEQAQAVMGLVKSDKASEAMNGRWHDDWSSYGQYAINMQAVLWLGIEATARKWIADNIPQAWFAPMFGGVPPLYPQEAAP